MFGENAGDVIIDHYDFVDFPHPLHREHSDGCRAAPYAHAVFFYSVDDRWMPGLHHHCRAAVDGHLYRLAVAQR